MTSDLRFLDTDRPPPSGRSWVILLDGDLHLWSVFLYFLGSPKVRKRGLDERIADIEPSSRPAMVQGAGSQQKVKKIWQEKPHMTMHRSAHGNSSEIENFFHCQMFPSSVQSR